MANRLRTTVSALLVLLTAATSAADDASSEDVAAETETATFSMYCYWTGEATLGRVEGVVASRIGHWGGAEIVQVDYDPARTDVASLAGALRAQRSLYARVVPEGASRAEAAAIDGLETVAYGGAPHFIDPKHSLRTRYPRLAALDLTEAQAIALNSWSYFGGPMPDVLTDAQKALVTTP